MSSRQVFVTLQEAGLPTDVTVVIHGTALERVDATSPAPVTGAGKTLKAVTAELAEALAALGGDNPQTTGLLDDPTPPYALYPANLNHLAPLGNPRATTK